MEGGHQGEEDRMGPATLPSSLSLQHSQQHQQQYGHYPDDRLPSLQQQSDSYDSQRFQHQHNNLYGHDSYGDSYGATSYRDSYHDTSWPQTVQQTPAIEGSCAHANSNFQAFSANASAVAASPVSHAANSHPVDPGDFYRNYGGVESSHAVEDPSSSSLNQDIFFMASASAIPVNNRQLPSGRANSHGTTSKPPPVSMTSPRNNGIRSGYRSASNPVDNRLDGYAGSSKATPTAVSNGYSGAPHRSVKDLTKKFDQQTSSQNAVPTARKPVSTSRNTSRTRDDGSDAYSTLRTGPPVRQTTGDSASTSTSRTPGSATRTAQRQKYLPEDQLSSNAQSFASRISKPGSANAIATNAQASKSMTYLMGDNVSPISPSDLANAPPLPPNSRLLFGEILPEQNDSRTAGFGIAVVRPRRTSDSHLPSPTIAAHQPAPSSPTDWYRAGVSSTAQNNGERQQNGNARTQIPLSSKGHGRAHSDLTTAGAKSTIPRLHHIPATARAHALTQPSQTQPTSPSSRLPRSVKKVNPSNRSSPASTRSSSPSTTKRLSGPGRTARQNVPSPSTRAKTPTKRANTPTTRSKTPTHAPTPASARRTPASINTGNGNNPPGSGRLNAYVAPPPSKLSPSLRSSRPRQSVASATTANSRMRAAGNDGPRSPTKPGSRATSRGPQSRRQSRATSRQGGQGEDDMPTTRRRKISVGPIDFAQRRETIKLAYSKSIKETRAQQARREAAEKGKKELETVARTELEAEAVVTAVLATEREKENEEPSRHIRPPAVQRNVSSKSEVVPLKIMTDIPSHEQQHGLDQAPTSLDSPTLGMPGGFPEGGSAEPSPEERHQQHFQDSVPQSAVSMTSVVTEFEIEPQTEPATQESTDTTLATSTIDADLGIMFQKPASEAFGVSQMPQAPQLYQKASYHYPFEEEVTPSERVATGGYVEIAPSHLSSEPTSALTEFEPEPEEIALGSNQHDDYEVRPYIYPAPSYKTTVTILNRQRDFIPLALASDDGVKADRHQTHGDHAVPSTDHYSKPDSRHGSSEVAKEPVLDVNNLESFYASPRLRDNIAALRNSTISSSDRDSLDGRRSTSEAHRTPDTSHSLMVPPLHAPGQRQSSASNWTDFSFGSVDDPDVPTKGYSLHGQESDFRGRQSIKTSPGLGSQSFRDSSYEDISRGTEVSPRDATTHLPRISDGLLPAELRLPELDTGAGLLSPYFTAEPVHVAELSSPLPPDHEPPPVPDEYELDETAYYNDTRPSSYLIANDEEIASPPQPASTPHSFEKVSMDTTDTQSFTLIPTQPSTTELPGPEQSDKEKKRLKQRQMVIKELIDTEDTFIRDMSVVEEIYKGTAEACPNLDAATVKVIFRNTAEIIQFHTAFLAQLKEGVTSVYVAKGRRSPLMKQESTKDLKDSDAATLNSVNSSGAASLNAALPDDTLDRKSSVGPIFSKNIDKLKSAHEGFLRSSDAATKRLIQIQEDEAVKVWLGECNEVAKELTTAWNLDSLLIKPMQRITKYPNLIGQLLEHTPADHPDREALVRAKSVVEGAILDINKTKKNFELVGQIVGRKRKESDVKAGIARAFGKRVDKLQAGARIPDDPDYVKHKDKFGDDYVSLQVVLRDVEFYTRTVSTYVHEFLQYLSSMELVMRLQPSKQYGHLESKWVQFNVSMRDIEKVLEQHLLTVRKDVIEPFEQIIRCYANPSTAMKKREKRRLDYEKAMTLKNAGKKVDKQLAELVDHYEALNETLKKELPKLSSLTAKMGNICLGRFVATQASWYAVWTEKIKVPLQDPSHVPEFAEIISAYNTDFRMMEEEIQSIGILNPTLRGRASQSTTDDASSTFSKTRSRPGEMTPRNRGLSINSDSVPSLPTPDFAKRNSGGNLALISPSLPSPNHAYYRDYYSGINGHSRGTSSPITPSLPGAPNTWAQTQRPSTGRSHDPHAMPRPSTDSSGRDVRRESGTSYSSPYPTGPEHHRRFSGLFHSALPLPDTHEESSATNGSHRAGGSRASSRDRRENNDGYNILWLAASLFEFNIETTKHEAGYPYLTYQAGEIFDVIAEKGELWLAKNQDDPGNQVGWIWSKHFAKLADS